MWIIKKDAFARVALIEKKTLCRLGNMFGNAALAIVFIANEFRIFLACGDIRWRVSLFYASKKKSVSNRTGHFRASKKWNLNQCRKYIDNLLGITSGSEWQSLDLVVLSQINRNIRNENNNKTHKTISPTTTNHLTSFGWKLRALADNNPLIWLFAFFSAASICCLSSANYDCVPKNHGMKNAHNPIVNRIRKLRSGRCTKN